MVLMVKYAPEHEDNMHPEAVIIVAFNDTIGIACNTDCAEPVIDDLIADHGEEADAGYDPANQAQVKRNRYCMNCGKKVEQ